MISIIKRKASRNARRVGDGFTLLEILLVLAIVVALATMVIPALRGPLANGRLRAAATTLREEFTRARIRAVETGRVQLFRSQIGGGDYELVDWDPAATATTDATDATAMENTPALETIDGGATLGQPTAPRHHTLAEGIEFVAASIDGDARRPSDAELEFESATADNRTWDRPILFYADGTTSSAEVILVNTDGRTISLRLRGLTGTTKLSEIATFDIAIGHKPPGPAPQPSAAPTPLPR